MARQRRPEMAWTRKHLLAMRDLDAAEITLLIDTAASLEEIATREIKKVPALRGKTIVNLFYESSTRTRTSFEIAGKWLSADVINFSASGSSTSKGESFIDTAKNIAAMSPDVVVVRHSSAGAAAILARELPCSIVNAGDGAHEHPTQALLDLLTIRERKGHFDGLHVAIVGDIAHSRVARSNIHGMRKLGMTVTVAGPPTLIPPYAQELGVKVAYRLEDAIRDVDVIMMLRLQQERMTAGLIPSLREYSHYWGLTLDKLAAHARPDVLIMHPGPVNRGGGRRDRRCDRQGRVPRAHRHPRAPARARLRVQGDRPHGDARRRRGRLHRSLHDGQHAARQRQPVDHRLHPGQGSHRRPRARLRDRRGDAWAAGGGAGRARRAGRSRLRGLLRRR